jgi:hypothetical protein
MVYLARTQRPGQRARAIASGCEHLAHRAGAARRVLNLVGGRVRPDPRQRQELCANEQGFSLHAGVYLQEPTLCAGDETYGVDRSPMDATIHDLTPWAPVDIDVE